MRKLEVDAEEQILTLQPIMDAFAAQARQAFPDCAVTVDRIQGSHAPARLRLLVVRGEGDAQRQHAVHFAPESGCAACFPHVRAFLYAPQAQVS